MKGVYRAMKDEYRVSSYEMRVPSCKVQASSNKYLISNKKVDSEYWKVSIKRRVSCSEKRLLNDNTE